MPPPPDFDWLAPIGARHESGMDSTSLALVVGDDGIAEIMAPALMDLDYRVIRLASAAEAVTALQSNDFSLVINLLADEPDESALHRFVNEMTMDRRRLIYYVLVGPDFKTMYNLEALCHSANMVLNSRDAGNLAIALTRGLSDYKELFGPYLVACNQS